jgi:ribonuclease HII
MTVFQEVVYVAGVDEVGRGPLAGPVVAAAVILDVARPISGLRDSKKLSSKRREYLSHVIMENCLSYAFGRAEVDEIDALNILQASLLAMKRAVEALSVMPNHALVDGKFAPDLDCGVTTIVGGDDSEDAIAAASIIAKVNRDHEMVQLHQFYPDYGFDQHKGYPTRFHLEAIRRHGVTSHHRRSFRPVKDLLEGLA